MRLLPAVVGGVAVVSSIVSVHLWRELHAERQVNAGLRNQMPQTSAPAGLSVPALSAPPPPPRPAEGPQASQPPPASTAMPLEMVEPAVVVNQIAQNGMLLADPGYRKALLAQALASLRAANPGLVEEMGLTTQEADEFFNSLAEHQLQLNEELSRMRTAGPIDADARARMQTAQQEGQTRLQDSLTAMLGRDRYLQYMDYQETRPARNSVAAIGNSLALAGQPLSAAQMRPFISAMAAAQKRQQSELQALPRNPGPGSSQGAMQMREQQLKRAEESNRVMLEAAGRHLTPSQLEIYRAQLEAQIAQSRAGLRVQQERERVLRAMQGDTG